MLGTDSYELTKPVTDYSYAQILTVEPVECPDYELETTLTFSDPAYFYQNDDETSVIRLTTDTPAGTYDIEQQTCVKATNATTILCYDAQIKVVVVEEEEVVEDTNTAPYFNSEPKDLYTTTCDSEVTLPEIVDNESHQVIVTLVAPPVFLEITENLITVSEDKCELGFHEVNIILTDELGRTATYSTIIRV